MMALAFYFFSACLLGSAASVIVTRHAVHAVLFLILTFFHAAILFILLGAELLAMLLVIIYVGAVAVLFLFVVMMLDLTPQTTRFFYTFQTLKTLWTHFLRWLRYTGIVAFTFISLTFVMSSFFSVGSLPLFYDGIPVLFAKLYAPVSLSPETQQLATFITVGCFLISFLISNRLTGMTFIGSTKSVLRLLPVSLGIGSVVLVELVVIIAYWSAPSPYAQQVITAPMPPAHLMTNTEALGLLIYKDYVYAFQASGLILLIGMVGAIVLMLRKKKTLKRQHIDQQVRRTREEAVTLYKARLGEGI